MGQCSCSSSTSTRHGCSTPCFCSRCRHSGPSVSCSTWSALPLLAKYVSARASQSISTCAFIRSTALSASSCLRFRLSASRLTTSRLHSTGRHESTAVWSWARRALSTCSGTCSMWSSLSSVSRFWSFGCVPSRPSRHISSRLYYSWSARSSTRQHILSPSRKATPTSTTSPYWPLRTAIALITPFSGPQLAKRSLSASSSCAIY